MLKLFRSYFEENEKQWLATTIGLRNQIQSLKSDRDFLLSKVPSSSDNIASLMDNFELTESNLASHKKAIVQVLGALHREEDDRIIA